MPVKKKLKPKSIRNVDNVIKENLNVSEPINRRKILKQNNKIPIEIENMPMNPSRCRGLLENLPQNASDSASR